MIGKFEANKDLIQELTTSGARRVGNIASIITGTVSEVTREIGEWITDAIEMNEAAAAARRDAAAGERGDDVREPGESRDVAGTASARETGVVLDADIVDAETDPSGTRH
jgi:ribosomal protein S17E